VILTWSCCLSPTDPQILEIERDLSQTLRDLSQTLRDLFQTLRVIRTIKNTHAPINKLPPEVLSRVFQHRDCGQDLVAATHVCRYWRSTLISDPSLWTSLKFRSTRDVNRTLTYLERSKPATIDIGINLEDLQDLRVLQNFAPHISRTRSFIIDGFSDVFAASSLLLCKPAPSLEHLSMQGYNNSAHALDNFLGQQAPSLRSATFIGICPLLGSPFPLPNLTELTLRLLGGMGPIRLSSVFRLCSSCPQLQKARIGVYCRILQNVALDQVLLLDSLVELEYTCNSVGRFLPFLKLPRLKRLRVFLEAGEVDKLADLLPHNGYTLLSGVTSMSHFYDRSSQAVELSGNGVSTSFTFENGTGATSAGWFSNHIYIPYEQIENLKFGGIYLSADFPFHLFKTLTTFRVYPWGEAIGAEVLGLLHPRPGAGIPCPSLRQIAYIFPQLGASCMRRLINLAREREQVGCQLELVCLLPTPQPFPELEEELGEHVGELRVDVSEAY
jgi:hypothetical protein